MPQFNLVTEPWIPVLTAGPPEELSLAGVFERATEVRAIAAPSPLATAAIYRLLIAIAHRVLPSDDAAWEELWEARDIRPGAIREYLERWKTRFDVFDPAYPFYQTPGLSPELANTIAKLTHERNAGNNPALFDHSLDSRPQPLTAAQAARALVALQAFAVGGLVTFEKGHTQDKSADAAPLVKGAVVVATGDNLVETLLLNLFRRNADNPFAHDPAADCPAWERDEPTQPMDRRPAGPLDLLTWQSRRVLLLPREDYDEPVVDRAVIMKGYQFPADFSLARSEPMLAFTIRRKPATGQDPMAPLGFRPDRSLWRDSLAFLNSAPPTSERNGRQLPKTLHDIAERGVVRRRTVGLAAYGLGVDRAKLLLWRSEQLPLALQYLERGAADLRGALDDGIQLAEEGARVLQTAIFVLASNVTAPEGNAEPARARDVAASLGSGLAYWAALDVHFRQFMAELPVDFDGTAGLRARVAWRDAVRRAALDAFDRAANPAENGAIGFRAAAQARGLLSSRLSSLLDAYTNNLPQESLV